MISGRALTPGHADGPVARLDVPLSFWGGYDALTGTVMDAHHPDYGRAIKGHILVMPAGRGSSSGASVVAEAARRGTAPLGIVLRRPDPILLTGLLVAKMLYGLDCPLALVSDDDWLKAACARALALDNEGETARLVLR